MGFVKPAGRKRRENVLGGQIFFDLAKNSVLLLYGKGL